MSCVPKQCAKQIEYTICGIAFGYIEQDRICFTQDKHVYELRTNICISQTSHSPRLNMELLNRCADEERSIFGCAVKFTKS